jgi:hypothetical protein
VVSPSAQTPLPGPAVVPATVVPDAAAASPGSVRPVVAEEAKSDARDILVGIYVDPEMDAALRDFEDTRIGGTGPRPSRSAVGNWLLTLGLEAARTQGMTSVPASFVKKRRRA